MAIRRHVAAELAGTEEDFRRALRPTFGDDAGAAEIVETHGWHWVMASVWGVSGAALDESLARLPGPCLRITTEDGDRWYLRLFTRGHDPFTACHEFHYPSLGEAAEAAALADFLADEEDRRQPFLTILDHFTSLGLPVPAEVAAGLAPLPYRDAVRELRQWQNSQILDALARFGIPHDRQSVLATLNWDDVGEPEAATDLGNLPRFLTKIGLDACFPGWLDPQPAAEELAEASEEKSPPSQEVEDSEGQRIQAILDHVAGLEPALIEGGSVPLPVRDLGRLKAIAEFCEEFVPAVVRIGTRPGTTVPIDEERFPGLLVRAVEDEVRIGFPTAHPLDFDARFTDELADVIAALPDGVRLELVTAGGDLDDSPAEPPAGSHRYAGMLRGGVWEIERAWPPAPRAALIEALELAGELAVGKGFDARDTAEAQAILEAARRDDDFHSRPVRQAGLHLWCDDWQRGSLAALLFRHRHGATWPTAARIVLGEEVGQDDVEVEVESIGSVWDPAPRRTSPRSGEVILDGRGGRSFRADLEKLPERDDVALEEAERGMRAIGFEHLGDLVLEQLDQLVIRAYATRSGDTYAMHVQTVAGDAQTEFITWFADGSILTTTTNSNGRSFPEQKMHVRSYSGLEAEALYGKHRNKVRRFAEAMSTSPLPFEPSLASVAAEIDEYMVRRSRC